MDLGAVTGLLLLVAAFAVFWRGRGVRELAYQHARQRCAAEGLQLLDGQVAFAGWRWYRGSAGQRYLARSYAFEFSARGVDRYRGTMLMRGRHLAAIELPPYPSLQDSPQEAVVTAEPQRQAVGQVIEVDFKSRNHD